MSRTLTFQFIADSRFSQDLKDKINRWDKTLKNEVGKLREVHLKDQQIKEVKFDNHTQLRKRYYINKNTRKFTWNDIYKLINSINAVPYDFIKNKEVY